MPTLGTKDDDDTQDDPNEDSTIGNEMLNLPSVISQLQGSIIALTTVITENFAKVAHTILLLNNIVVF